MLVQELSARDRSLVLLVGQLNQLDTSNLKQLLFADVSRVSMDRALKRLAAAKYVRRIGRRASGLKGGTGASVYMLGPKGWWYCQKPGKYWGYRAVSEHSLKVADLYTRLTLMHRAGQIKLLAGIEVEHPVGNGRADLYFDVAVPALRRRRRFYVEVQLSARPEVIHRKIRAYTDAYEAATEAVWPYVAFVVWDEWHRDQIQRAIPAQAGELFRLYMASDFLAAVISP